jgi:two-component system, NtrC family, sensor histidine kinase HupT/HoxJ
MTDNDLLNPPASLLMKAGVGGSLELDAGSENAWIEVIRKMDSVYADLVHYQIELEQKNAALELAQQFIDSVLSSMTDVLIVCDTGSRVQQVNAALEKLTGIPASEFIGKPLVEVFGDDSRSKLQHFPERLGSHSLIDCEVNLRCADGSNAPLAMNCSSRYNNSGGLVGMVLIGRPVGELRRAYDDLNQAHHELKQAQQQLVQSEKMASLGRLVAGVAHELNNPISFVFGNMHALKRYGERLTRYLERVEQETDSPALRQLHEELRIGRILDDIEPLIDGTLEGAERVSDIVQDLRRYSGGQREEPALFDLPAAIRKAVQWVIKAERIKPEVHYTLPSKLKYLGRKGQLHQILINLVQNAADAMEKRAQQLDVVCQTNASGQIEIRIRDYGPGIPEKHLPHLFDPFYTSKPVGQGTGLGLYISYGLAEEMRGNLRARNHSEGGAEFILELPREGADEAGAGGGQ